MLLEIDLILKLVKVITERRNFVRINRQCRVVLWPRVRLKNERRRDRFTFSATTLSVMTFRIMTFSKTINKSRHSIMTLLFCYAECPVFWMSFLLSVANKPYILSVIMLNVILLSVVAPHIFIYFWCYPLKDERDPWLAFTMTKLLSAITNWYFQIFHQVE